MCFILCAPMKGTRMLKWIGTIGAVALAARLLERREITAGSSHLESVAEAELRKVLLYAAPPTFLAPVGVVHDDHPRRRWADRVS